MKKMIIFTVYFCFLFMTRLNASEFSEWTTELPEDTTNLIIESENRYKWYREVETNVSYEIFGEGKQEFIDENDFKFSELKYSQIIPEEKPNREVNMKKVSLKYNTEFINKIELLNLDNTFNITEIEVYDKNTNEKIPYKVDCKNCYPVINKINNDRIIETSSIFSKNSRLILMFESLIKLSDIEIIIYFNDISLVKTFDLGFSYSLNNNVTISNFQVDKTKYYKDGLIVCMQKLIPIDNNKQLLDEEEFLVYEYKDKLFKYYDKTKEYLSGYYIHIEDYIKDEESEVTYYRYKEVELMKNEQTIEKSVQKEDKEQKNIYYPKENIVYKLIETSEENESVVENIREDKIAMADSTIEKENSSNIFVYIVPLIFVLIGIISYIVFKKIKK